MYGRLAEDGTGQVRGREKTKEKGEEPERETEATRFFLSFLL